MTEYPYDKIKATQYARKWAMSRNPAYFDFEDYGGDCTNFISQCIYAGAPMMNYTRTYGWYYNSSYDRAPAWTGVEFLSAFLLKNKSAGPFAVEKELSLSELGDIIQLGTKKSFHHSVIITGFTDDDTHSENNILVSTHSFDAVDRLLSTYIYDRLKCLEIKGYRRY